MKKDNMMTMVLVIGGLGAAYWYITRYGPNGAAYNAAGQQVAPTWWDTWFGAVAVQAAAPAPATQTQTPGGSTQPAPSATVDVRTALLTAAGGATALNADQWNYYRNALYPPSLSGHQFGLAFPTRTDPMPTMSVDQFLAALQAGGINAANPNAGLQGVGRVGAIMQTATTPQVPSMSFGGSLATTRPRISAGRRPVVGGGFTIQ